MKHSLGRCVIGSFDKHLHQVSICNGHRSVLSFILQKSTFFHFVYNGALIYEKYISFKIRKKFDDKGSGVLHKQEVNKKYNSKYQLNYSN